MNAQPRSLPGLAWVFAGCKVEQGEAASTAGSLLAHACVPPPRSVASGPMPVYMARLGLER